MTDPRLIALVAERDRHVRDMLDLLHVSDKHGCDGTRVKATLQTWTNEWLANNPRQAALFISRLAVAS